MTSSLTRPHVSQAQQSAQTSTALVQQRAVDDITRVVAAHELRLTEAAQAVVAQIMSRLAGLPGELLGEIAARLGPEVLEPLFSQTDALSDRLGRLQGELTTTTEVWPNAYSYYELHSASDRQPILFLR